MYVLTLDDSVAMTLYGNIGIRPQNNDFDDILVLTKQTLTYQCAGLFQAIPHFVLMHICAVLLEELQVEDRHHKSFRYANWFEQKVPHAHTTSHQNQKFKLQPCRSTIQNV